MKSTDAAVRGPPARATGGDGGASVAERLAEAIGSAILRGELAPGQRLVESDLQQQWNAARSSVREALRLLAARGLVTLAANRGASVRRLSQGEITDLFAIRERLEALAAATAARRVGAGLATAPANKLRTLTSRMAAISRRGDAGAYGSLNRQWHALVVKLSGNAELEQLLAHLSLPVLHRQFVGFLDPAHQRRSHAEHEAITAAILAGDAALADRLMARHIRHGFRLVQGWAGTCAKVAES
jgi:DNA-binding GntR family transcriptional regulator